MGQSKGSARGPFLGLLCQSLGGSRGVLRPKISGPVWPIQERVRSSQLAHDLGLKAHFEGNCIHFGDFSLLEGVLMPILREFWSYEGAEIE